MFLCFIDESTTPPKPTKKNHQTYFVMAGVFIPMAQWHEINLELKRLKERREFRIRGEIKWRFFGPDNNDPANCVGHLSQEQKDDFRQRFFDILAKRNSVKCVAGVTDIAKAYEKTYVNDEHDLYHYTYKMLTEMFQYHLQDISRSIGSTHLGIIVADHRGRDDDERVRREHQRLIHSSAANTATYSHLVENVFLAPSHTSIGIQFADMVAGAVQRTANAGEQKWLEMVLPFMRKRQDDSIEGFGIRRFPYEPLAAGWRGKPPA